MCVWYLFNVWLVSDVCLVYVRCVWCECLVTLVCERYEYSLCDLCVQYASVLFVCVSCASGVGLKCVW